MKNTAKTLTLTAKKAPAKSATAQLAVPKTATSYFLETEAAAKVTVVKTRSRLAALKAPADEAHAAVAKAAPVDAAGDARLDGFRRVVGGRDILGCDGHCCQGALVCGQGGQLRTALAHDDGD